MKILSLLLFTFLVLFGGTKEAKIEKELRAQVALANREKDSALFEHKSLTASVETLNKENASLRIKISSLSATNETLLEQVTRGQSQLKSQSEAISAQAKILDVVRNSSGSSKKSEDLAAKRNEQEQQALDRNQLQTKTSKIELSHEISDIKTVADKSLKLSQKIEKKQIEDRQSINLLAERTDEQKYKFYIVLVFLIAIATILVINIFIDKSTVARK